MPAQAPGIIQGDEPQATSADDFVGPDVCGECHAPQFAAWRGSTHGRAGGLPSPETVIAPFDGTPIRFADAVVTPFVSDETQYVFRVERDDREPLLFEVVGVVGRGHMEGGGTQGFLSAFPDGTVRFLPFDYSRHEGSWFCNTAYIAGEWTSTGALASLRPDVGWVPITSDLALTDCGDWPPVRVFGADTRSPNCQGCHGSQITVRFDRTKKAYRTRIGSLAVNCEACHGPGRGHVQLAKSERIRQQADLRIAVPDTLDKDASLGICFQCHALKRLVAPDTASGGPMANRYSRALALVGARPLHPDGRVRSFAYQMNHLASDCYLNGSMTCVDCHDPHSQRYRDVVRQPLEGRFHDGQCLACHPSKAATEEHSHHPPESPGSRCVACHMPYLQHPEVGDRVRYARSDHTIPVPRPAEDARLGIRSACTTCHADMTAQEMEARARAWYGDLKPRDPVVAELLRAEWAGDPHLTLQPGVRSPLAQVMSIDYLLERLLRPDMDDVDPAIVAGLAALARDPDPEVRAVALAALHLAAGRDPSVSSLLRSPLQGNAPEDAAVRRRWVVALGLIAERYRARGDAVSTILTYGKALEVDPEDEGTLLGLGVVFAQLGDDSTAAGFYRRVLARDPAQPVALLNLGLALENLGSTAEAETAYRQAVEANPREGQALMNLGNLRLREGDFPAAIQQYRAAVEAEPWLGRAYYYLGVAYVNTGDMERAADAFRAALEFEPGNRDARVLLQELTRQTRPGGAP